jgi:hypothetical protein
MFVLGHVGIAVGAVHFLDRKADLRWIALAALLPDLIDKPIWFLELGFANGWTRSAAHSVTGLGVFAVLALWALRERAWGPIFAYASHLFLDRMWWDATILLWPFEGFILPKFTRDHLELWWEKLTDPWTMGGEATGLILLAVLWVRGRMWDPERRRAFKATGRLA